MKTILTATLLFIPCLAILNENENENIWINVLGFMYIVAIFALCKRKSGKLFLKKLYKETMYMNSKLFG